MLSSCCPFLDFESCLDSNPKSQVRSDRLDPSPLFKLVMLKILLIALFGMKCQLLVSAAGLLCLTPQQEEAEKRHGYNRVQALPAQSDVNDD